MPSLSEGTVVQVSMYCGSAAWACESSSPSVAPHTGVLDNTGRMIIAPYTDVLDNAGGMIIATQGPCMIPLLQNSPPCWAICEGYIRSKAPLSGRSFWAEALVGPGVCVACAMESAV